MKVKTQSSRNRATSWARRRRAARGANAPQARPENQQRMWSLLLRPGYTNERR